jgi:hypothetical protein
MFCAIFPKSKNPYFLLFLMIACSRGAVAIEHHRAPEIIFMGANLSPQNPYLNI